MFDYIYGLWDSYGYGLILLFCCIFIIVMIVLNFGKEGKYKSVDYYKKLHQDLINDFLPIEKNNYVEISNYNFDERNDSKGEIQCRRILESIFQRPFPKCRPNFLNNTVTGGKNNLELDCYNNYLGIALEYNGKQHYEYTPFMHKNKQDFYNQKYRDEMKARICEQYGIDLITVPYRVKPKDLKFFIMERLEKINKKRQKFNKQ